MADAVLRPLTAPRRARAAPAVRAARAARAAALLSLAAAYVHLAYAESHWRVWWAYGAFFLATGVGQAIFVPLVLYRPRRWMALVAIVGNVAIVGMYVLSRTAGPPLGPHAHVAETAAPIDLATTAAEVVLVGVLLTLIGRSSRRFLLNALLLMGLALWALRLTGRLP
jgi:hypothetical protein